MGFVLETEKLGDYELTEAERVEKARLDKLAELTQRREYRKSLPEEVKSKRREDDRALKARQYANPEERVKLLAASVKSRHKMRLSRKDAIKCHLCTFVCSRKCIPTAATGPEHCMLMLAVEATLCWVFWTMRPTERRMKISSLCPWDVTSLEYNGICGHSALAESTHLGDYEFTEAQRLEKAERQIERSRRLLIEGEHRSGPSSQGQGP